MAFQPENDFLCPICHDIFKEPVVLSCSHSFCKDCLTSWWKEKPTRECPVCNRRSSKSDPPRNLALKNLCEAFPQQRKQISEEDLCKLHSEKLKLFCLSDQQPVCIVCRDSTAHKNHKFKPIDEATTDLKEKLQKSLDPLKERLKLVEGFKEDCDLTLAHIKKQSCHTERQIVAQFFKLQNFLTEQQEAQMRALRAEEEQKTQRIKDKMAAVSREIEALSETIRATEEQLRAADLSFLLKYKAAEERVQCCPLLEEPQLGPGVLIDQAKYLGNLGFNIWSNLKRMVEYTPVILDPNTASPELGLSDNLTSLKTKAKEQLPKNPERFKMDFSLVRGSEGFDSGSHSWDVTVGDSDRWLLGVVTESLFQITEEHFDPAVGGWIIIFDKGQYEILNLKKKDTIVKVKSNPQRIRIHLECDKRKLTLYDAVTKTRIHSFTKLYQQKLFPVFSSVDLISILPQNI